MVRFWGKARVKPDAQPGGQLPSEGEARRGKGEMEDDVFIGGAGEMALGKRNMRENERVRVGTTGLLL